jgi:hypothetical protein
MYVIVPAPLAHPVSARQDKFAVSMDFVKGSMQIDASGAIAWFAAGAAAGLALLLLRWRIAA